MSYLFTGLLGGGQITLGTSTIYGPEAYGTHVSHFGIGGYQEFPSYEYLTSVPSAPIEDGYSCGRRKWGMIAYTMDSGKYYQLIPSWSGVPVTPQQWTGFTATQKYVALDPAAIVEDPDTFDLVSGSNNPSDVWVEIFKSANSNGASAGGGIIPSGFNVIQTSIGSYSDGMFISGGTLVTDVIKRMLQKKVLHVYQNPSATATWGGTASLYEIGAPISQFTIVPTYVQRDGGAFNGSWAYFKDGVNNGSATISQFAAKSSTTFMVSGNYDEGPVRPDSLGDPTPGNVQPGFVTASFTTSAIYPWYYFKTSNASFTINDMKTAIQNGTATKLVASSNGTITVPFNVNAEHIGVAYPAASTTKTNYWSSNSDLGGIESVFLPVQTSSISSPDSYWTNVSYKFHITDSRKTNPNPNLELRN